MKLPTHVYNNLSYLKYLNLHILEVSEYDITGIRTIYIQTIYTKTEILCY